MDLGTSMLRVASQRWTAYRAAPPASDVGGTAASTSWFSRLPSSRSAPVPVGAQYQEEPLQADAGFSGPASARFAAQDGPTAEQPPARMQTRSSIRLRASPANGEAMSGVSGTGAMPPTEAPVINPATRSAAGRPRAQQSSDAGNEGVGRSGRLESQGSWFGSSRWVAGGSAADDSGAVENLGAAVGSALWQYMNQRAGQGQSPSGHEPRTSRQGRQGDARQGRNEL